MFTWPQSRLLVLAQWVLVAVLVGLVCWAGIALTREAGRVATIWPANGFLIGWLLRIPSQRWPGFLLAGFVGNLGADLASGDAGLVGVGLALCNSAEVLLAAWPLHRLIGNDLDPVRLAACGPRFVPWVLAAPVLPSLLGAGLVALTSGEPLWTVLRLWYAADLLGLVIMMPFVLALNRRVADRLFTGTQKVENGLALVLLVVVTVGVFAQSDYPFLFLVYPPLLLLVFRLGLAGAPLGLVVVSAIAVVLTVEGHGPFALVHMASIPVRVLLLQFFVAVASLMAYPVGVILTERKRLQSTLAESECRYRTLSEHSNDIIVRARIDGTRVYISSSVSELLGWSPEMLLGEARLEFVHPEDQALFRQELEALQQGLRRSTLVYRYRHKDGHYVWMESTSRRVVGSGPSGEDEIVRTVRDISRRKAAEEAWAKSDRDLRAVTDNLPALISFVDADGVVQFCNATHEEWLGRPCSELIGRHLHEIFGIEAYARLRGPLSEALLGERIEFEWTLVGAEGRTRHTRVSYVPRRSSQGVINGVYALIMDMTAIKTVEQELTRLARFDTLTGLANRHQFNERLEAATARARREGTPLALLYIDVDEFKRINDTWGHAAGDEVLREVAERIHRCVRTTDMAARLAGDEFVVVLEGLRGAEEAQIISRKILKRMVEPFMLSTGPVHVTVSVGIAFVMSGAVSSAEVLRLADAALYEAKAAGRNTWRVVGATTTGVVIQRSAGRG